MEEPFNPQRQVEEGLYAFEFYYIYDKELINLKTVYKSKHNTLKIRDASENIKKEQTFYVCYVNKKKGYTIKCSSTVKYLTIDPINDKVTLEKRNKQTNDQIYDFELIKSDVKNDDKIVRIISRVTNKPIPFDKNMNNHLYAIYFEHEPDTDSDSDDEYSNQCSRGVASKRHNIIKKFMTKNNYGSKCVSNSSNRSMGFSTGGAKDIGNFRQKIKSNKMPSNSDITYEGIFYDYYFDTGEQDSKPSKYLFSPSYSYGICYNPLNNELEYYLSVGLNSNIKESDFKRNKLNIVVVLDISGSMSSSFNEYYNSNSENKILDAVSTKSKQEIANESICNLLNHLKNDDRFGMVLFDNTAYIAKQLTAVKHINMSEMKKYILELTPNGGTNFEAGYTTGTKLFNKILYDKNFDNRIIFLTDAMPNVGSINKTELLGLTKYNAENSKLNIFTTFIGIGIDFNTNLIEYISKIKGCNYYSIHNSIEFNKRLNDEFELMVTPLVFDLNLNIVSTGYEIVDVYGSPEANKSTGNIICVNTLFPSSKNENNETKGGIVILKLKKKEITKNNNSNNLILSVSYRDRLNNKYKCNESINVFNSNYKTNKHIKLGLFDNLGIRKGILLIRYVNLLKQWISNNSNKFFESELKMTKTYKNLFTSFLSHFKQENEFIKDKTLKQEIEILNRLINL